MKNAANILASLSKYRSFQEPSQKCYYYIAQEMNRELLWRHGQAVSFQQDCTAVAIWFANGCLLTGRNCFGNMFEHSVATIAHQPPPLLPYNVFKLPKGLVTPREYNASVSRHIYNPARLKRKYVPLPPPNRKRNEGFSTVLMPGVEFGNECWIEQQQPYLAFASAGGNIEWKRWRSCEGEVKKDGLAKLSSGPPSIWNMWMDGYLTRQDERDPL